MSEPTALPESALACRVLIVPHCSECGECLRMLLSLMGYRAEVVRGGNAAVRRAREVLPQAVLLDLDLPRDGWEVCRRLRKYLGSAARLIAITSNAREADPAGWAAAGFDGWLVAPVNPDELLGLLPRR